MAATLEDIRNETTIPIASSESRVHQLDQAEFTDALCLFPPMSESDKWQEMATASNDDFPNGNTAKRKKSLIDLISCVSLHNVEGKFSRSPSSPRSKISEGTQLCEKAIDIKCKWRQQQISIQNKHSLPINSSWRTCQITCLWCGWLLKRASNIVGRWQERWFELRRKVASDRSSAHCAVLQYTRRDRNGRDSVKQLTLVDARREYDPDGRACVSVSTAERRGRVLLAADSDRAAEELLVQIAAILRPPASG
jgi:hypothetical protein